MGAIRPKKWRVPKDPRLDLYQHPSTLIRWYVWKRIDVALDISGLQNSYERNVVLDLGCGLGYFLPTLAAYSNKVLGVDPYPWDCRKGEWGDEVVGWNEGRIAFQLVTEELGPENNVYIIRGDGFALPLKNESVDFVFLLDTLEHLDNAEPILSECARVLNPHGGLVVSMPIEVGLALFLKEIVSKMTRIKRYQYTAIELLNLVIKTKAPVVSRERVVAHHKGFDYRPDIALIKKKFRITEIHYCPVRFLGSLNPTVILKAVKGFSGNSGHEAIVQQKGILSRRKSF